MPKAVAVLGDASGFLVGDAENDRVPRRVRRSPAAPPSSARPRRSRRSTARRRGSRSRCRTGPRSDSTFFVVSVSSCGCVWPARQGRAPSRSAARSRRRRTPSSSRPRRPTVAARPLPAGSRAQLTRVVLGVDGHRLAGARTGVGVTSPSCSGMGSGAAAVRRDSGLRPAGDSGSFAADGARLPERAGLGAWFHWTCGRAASRETDLFFCRRYAAPLSIAGRSSSRSTTR